MGSEAMEYLVLCAVLAFIVVAPLWVAHRVAARIAASSSLTRVQRCVAAGVVRVLGWLVPAVVLCLLLLPSVSSAPKAVRRAACANNLKQIALAMSNYREKHGCFPPAYSVDKEGRPLHTWRVLLLPFMGEKALYDRLRLDEPWDSPHNQAVFDSVGAEHGRAGRTPDCYRCPADTRNRVDTNYTMLVGPRTISNGSGCVRLKDITDGPGKTICVVEVTGSGVRWYEPVDLDAEQMSYRINDPEVWGIGSRHFGAHVATCDGSVHLLPDSADPELVKGASTINGGEDVSGLFR
jgi:hypothetical protein